MKKDERNMFIMFAIIFLLGGIGIIVPYEILKPIIWVAIITLYCFMIRYC